MKTYLSPNEIRSMLEKAPCLRDKVLIAFYGETGCRVSELLKVNVSDVDLDQGVVLIPHLKRGIHKTCPSCGKSAGRNSAFCAKCGEDLRDVKAEGIEQRHRFIAIGEETIALLREWVIGMQPEEPLINLSRQRVYCIVRELASLIGLGGRVILNPETGKKHFVHPHNFRDSLAASWLGLRPDAEGQKALQQHLGHKSFETTARYFKLSTTTVHQISDEIRKARFGGTDGRGTGGRRNQGNQVR